MAIIVMACVAQVAGAQSGVAPARQLFQKYIALGNAFDSSLADLYSDEALIRNTRRYPNGQKRTIEIPAAKYKELIRSAIAIAKAKGDKNRYSSVKYKREGGNVRISATRYSLMKKYSSPISLLVGANKEGEWQILEEISESIP
jgi:hypothetical protein